MLTKRSVIAAKVESSYNTDATPTAASDAIRVENLSPSPAEGARMAEQASVRPSLGTKPQLYVGSLMALEFDVPLKHSGTVDTAPEWGPLMKACGCAETVNASTSVVYEPASSGHDSVSIYWFQDGRRWVLTGARGNVQIVCESGMYGKLRFRFVGHVSGPTDVSLPSPTIDSTAPVTLRSMGITIGGDTLEIASLSLDMGSSLGTPDDLNAADVYGEIVITGRDCNGSVDPKAVLVATKDIIANWRGDVGEAINTGTIGSTAGNQWKLEMPACRIREPSVGDRDGIATDEFTFGAHENSGDDEFTLTLT